ncbi:MAG: hypothetical protein OXG47_08655 [bacterium]|nr:hypothetical protein [bacterium]
MIAAVASFGALAVFVLTETVDDAVDRAGADDPARLASARHAARLVEIEAVTVTPANWPLHLWGEWEDYFDTKCQNIRNAFAAHGINVEEPEFRASSETNEADRRTEPIIMVTAGDPVVRTFTPGAQARLARADDTPPSATKPQAKCSVP